MKVSGAALMKGRGLSQSKYLHPDANTFLDLWSFAQSQSGFGALVRNIHWLHSAHLCCTEAPLITQAHRGACIHEIRGGVIMEKEICKGHKRSKSEYMVRTFKRDPHSEGPNSFYLEKSQDEGLLNPQIIKSPL